MAAPVTKTDIVNGAAALLGSTERVSSIDGSGNLARHANAVWDITMRRLLADHPWNFAIARAELNAGPAPAFGFLFSYALPADCLRALSFVDADEYEFLFAIEAGQLLTDSEAPVFCRYISSGQVDNPAAWPPHLADAAIYALAQALAEALTGAQGLDNKLTDKADAAMRRARRIDGRESQTHAKRDISVRSNFLRSMRPDYPWRPR